MLLLPGCAEQVRPRWWQGEVIVEGETCRTAPGQKAVLEIDDLVVARVSGYLETNARVFIQLDKPEALPAGTTLQVPSTGVSALMCIADLDKKVLHDVEGSIRVLESDGTDFDARVELKSATANWDFDQDVRFEKQGRP